MQATIPHLTRSSLHRRLQRHGISRALAATGRPIVVLLRHGRALAPTGAVRDAPAIMATWFLASETGNAPADVAFGERSPQGRLPVSFPQASGQEPFYYDHRTTGRPQLGTDRSFRSRYRKMADAALYPFGPGLFERHLRVDAGRGDAGARRTAGGDGHRRQHRIAPNARDRAVLRPRQGGVRHPARA